MTPDTAFNWNYVYLLSGLIGLSNVMLAVIHFIFTISKDESTSESIPLNQQLEILREHSAISLSERMQIAEMVSDGKYAKDDNQNFCRFAVRLDLSDKKSASDNLSTMTVCAQDILAHNSSPSAVYVFSKQLIAFYPDFPAYANNNTCRVREELVSLVSWRLGELDLDHRVRSKVVIFDKKFTLNASYDAANYLLNFCQLNISSISDKYANLCVNGLAGKGFVLKKDQRAYFDVTTINENVTEISDYLFERDNELAEEMCDFAVKETNTYIPDSSSEEEDNEEDSSLEEEDEENNEEEDSSLEDSSLEEEDVSEEVAKRVVDMLNKQFSPDKEGQEDLNRMKKEAENKSMEELFAEGVKCLEGFNLKDDDKKDVESLKNIASGLGKLKENFLGLLTRRYGEEGPAKVLSMEPEEIRKIFAGSACESTD